MRWILRSVFGVLEACIYFALFGGLVVSIIAALNAFWGIDVMAMRV